MWQAKPLVDEDAPGGACIDGEDSAAVELGADGFPVEQRYAGEYEELIAATGLVRCGASPGAAVLTPAAWADSWFRSQVFPQPAPSLADGSYVTGLDGSLDTGTEMRVVRQEASPFGPATLVLDSHLSVDWGDGTTTGPHHEPGAPHPDGTIRHVYQEPGFYDVAVTQHWTLVWSVGSEGGTIGGVTTSGTLEDLEIFSVEAVLAE